MHLASVTLRLSLLALAAGPLAPTRARGQDTWDPTRVYASRAGLDSLARKLEASAESPAYSEVLRAEARVEANSLRARLRDGDFQVGDLIVLAVQGETALSDTFAVEAGPSIQLPTIGRLSIERVLRSELDAHLARELARYIRQPDVVAQTLIRISVTGEVTRPGFYAVPTQLLVTDVLVLAGQVTPNADVNKIRIERGDRTIWDSEALGPEIVGGRTLDQLGVRAGDRLFLGRRPPSLGSLEGTTRTLLLIVGLPATIVGLIAVFR
jgi:protein involved in polysaccharide export with SLBB domain